MKNVERLVVAALIGCGLLCVAAAQDGQKAWLDISLSPEQRKQAVFAFTSNERLHWNYIPSEAFPRNGLMVKDMSDAQRKLAHDLLKAGLKKLRFRRSPPRKS